MKDKIAGLKPGKHNLLNYLFVGALLYRSIPYLLNVLVLVTTRKPIPKMVNDLFDYAGILILLLFGLMLWKAVGYEKKTDALGGGAILGLAGMVNAVGGTALTSIVLVRFLEQPAIYYLLCGLLQIVYMTLIVWALPGGKCSIKKLGICYGICIAGSVAMLGVDGILGLLEGMIQMSFGTNLVLRAVRATADASIIYALVLFGKSGKQETVQEAVIEEAVAEVTDEGETAAQALASEEVKAEKPIAVVKRKGAPRFVIACVGIVLCFVVQSFAFERTPEEGIHASIAEDIALGSMELAMGNVESATEFYNRAWERKSAWEYVAGVTNNAEVFHAASKSSLLEVRMLVWLKNGDINAMEKCLMEEDVGLDFAIELLDVYAAKAENLSERSQIIRKDIISLMIATDTFTDTVISPKDMEGRRYKLADRLDEMEKVEIYCDAVDLLADTGKNGGINRERAEKMLAIAEQEPLDINLQYFAVAYGCAYKSDSANHYERTMQAGERFVALLEKTEDLSLEQKYQSRMMLADWAMELGLFEKALGYIEDALEIQETEALLITLAQCQQDLKKTQECVETAERILALNPDNYGAVYYRAVGRLKNGDVDGSIEDTLKLCELVQSLEGEERHQAEVMLYDVLQYQGFSDLTYNYMIYRRLSEEQRARIEESDFYAAYLDAVYCCFSSKDYEVALDSVNRVLSAEPGLAQASYLRGCIYFGKQDFAMAAKSYEEAVDADGTSATAWYCLANAYEELGEFEKAYEASVKVDALLPDTDHLFDPYGIAIHNDRLKDRISKEVGR